ncbi:xanthine dehydrogenase accessory protein XdhC [Elongatibacter sediminis]|uniref:Xanthine dehydrogenase accessory protein XdhC n=1 Tax=Elongatibacter sediminis TaxID=3119006 RepID=A0AAW9R9G3_9GAMM
MSDWPTQLEDTLRHSPAVLVTLNRLAGSAPRESGCRMIVTADETLGSIGGGNLEYTATARARALLAEATGPRQVAEPYGLGPAMQQCCGGAVTLLYEVLSGECPQWVRDIARARREGEPMVLAQELEGDPPRRSVVPFRGPGHPPVPPPVRETARDVMSAPPGEGAEPLPTVEYEGRTWWLERLAPGRWPLYLFGAGHVGAEVARLLERLPFEVSWIDGRPGMFPAESAPNIALRSTDDPAGEVGTAPAGTLFIVMSHSHPLDQDICEAVLRRGDFSWLGLIGSDAKRKRFVHRLGRAGIPADRLERLVCPIGLDGLDGKQPANIALSVAAQLMMEKPWIPADN